MKNKEYYKTYYLKNRDRIREQGIKYHLKNRNKILKQKTEYYLRNKDRILKRQVEYRLKNKDKVRKYRLKYREKNNKRTKEFYHQNLLSWLDYIPRETNCQICDKKIYFMGNEGKKAIHFDHKEDDYFKIIIAPTRWLGNHRNTPENRKIWENCNFGMLCKTCNSFLPTNNRKEYIQKVIKYIEKSK